MNDAAKKNDEIEVYLEDREYMANMYVMKCVDVTMALYTLVFVLNLLNIFIVDKMLMLQGYMPSLIIYVAIFFVTRKISLSNRRTKYLVLFSVITEITIIGVSLTYHAVLGMNEIILRECTESNIRKYAEDVKDSLIALLGVINEILDSPKVESGIIEITPADYEIGSFLNNLYNMINIKEKEKGLSLVFDVDKNIPSVLNGDDRRIRQVLVNILDECCKIYGNGTGDAERCEAGERRNHALFC